MKRILFIILLAFSVLISYAYNVADRAAEIVGREPNYILSNSWNYRMPIYLGFSTFGLDSIGTVNIRAYNNGNFDTIKVDGSVVLSLDSPSTVAEINLNKFNSVYLDDVTHMLELYNGESFLAKLYFASHLPEKGGCLLFCPDEPNEATVVGFVPYVTDVYVPEEFWVTEEWCMPVEEIAKQAFYNATNMESIVIPSTLRTIESNAFEGCTNLNRVVFKDGEGSVAIRNLSEGPLFKDSPLESVHLGYMLLDTSGYRISSPFKNHPELETFTFGPGELSLVNDMFQGCTSLKSIVIPENVLIPTDYYPDRYTYTSPDYGTFADCTSLEEVEILSPMTSTVIGMFSQCHSLKSLKLPTEIETIAPFTFSNCYLITEIPNFPNLKRIGDSAFRNCQGLEHVVLPPSVKDIKGNYSFGWCSNLKSIVLPPDVETIGYDPFDFCKNLSEVTYNTENPKEFSYRMFLDSPPSRTLYVPKNSIEKFKELQPWKAFGYIKPIPVPTQSIKIDKVQLSLKAGEQVLLSASVTPEEATDEFIWSTDNEEIADVDSIGLVTAKSVGEANISVQSGDFSAVCKVTVVPTPVESITLSHQSVTLKVAESMTLTATVLPEDATDKTVVWASDNSSVVMVDENGHISAMTLGSATITASCGNVSASCLVTVASTPVESITLSHQSVTLKVAESMTLTATVLPEDATDKTVVWVSDNSSVATVDENGHISAMTLGSATITASCGNVSASCVVTVESTPVESITLSHQSVTMKVAESMTLTATVLPENATDKTVVWSSDQEFVVVDEKGYVVAMAIGTATITATCGEAIATCVVTVVPTPVDSVELSKSEAQLKVGESLILTATVFPDDATDKTVIWASDNTSVATVDEMGIVTAISLGSATITASCGDVYASCEVTVVATEVENISISNENVEMVVDDGIQLEVTVMPENATDKSIIWSSSDDSVAMVDSEGNVTAVSVGKATITATAADGSGVSATCNVTVLPVLVESIVLTPDSWSGEEGLTFQIDASVLPDNATEKKLRWISSDKTVAIVDEDGFVVVLKEGDCVITATATDGSGVYAECIVTGLAGLDEIFSDIDFFDIYDLNGIQIKKDCNKEDLKLLTPGIYIIRLGDTIKKIVIR